MVPASDGNLSLAVLIDADNANPGIVDGLLAEVAKFGVASVKRIYGDWTTPNLGAWKQVLLEHSIQPVQQFRYTTGKNATDSAMIIDAMDLLYSGTYDGFCIVSSDSDFTRLASRLREAGKRVMGFGEKKTPKPFVSACDRFIYTEVFLPAENKPEVAKAKLTNELRQDTRLMNLVRKAIEETSDEDGWANLSGVGSNVSKQAPEFQARNYGYAKLSDLIEAIGLFEISRREKGVLVRDKKAKPKANAGA